MKLRKRKTLGMCFGASVILVFIAGCSAAASTQPRLVDQQEKIYMDSIAQDKSSDAKPARRLVLCLDGTWNGTYTKERRNDGSTVLKPTNVLKLCRSVTPKDDSGTVQITYYDIGVGALPRYPGTSNALLSKFDKYLGGVWGAGFESNVEAALDFLVHNYQEGDQVFVFGFSRGAATARGVTRFIGWAGGLPTKGDAYYLPLLFREYVRTRGSFDFEEALSKTLGVSTLSDQKSSVAPFKQVGIDYLGIWDTVMALGSRFQAVGENNSTVSRSFYVDRAPARSVRHARQALAIDEERFDFRPEIWSGHSQGQTLEQRWFAGVHSNVGGGYLDDGLANVAFHWILKGAVEKGLEIDEKFAAHYRAFYQDKLYESYTFGSKLVEMLRFRLGRGTRSLVNQPEQANLSMDKSVIHRLRADPDERKPDGELRYPEMRGKAYRPTNVLQYLACQEDLIQYLKDIGLTKERHLELPQDVLDEIGVLRSECTPKNSKRQGEFS